MVFNSLTFLVFFAVLLALHYLPFLSWKAKKVNLLVASYVFYAAWNPPFILLLWASTIVDWFIARGIYAARDRSRAATRKRAARSSTRSAPSGRPRASRWAGSSPSRASPRPR